MAQIILTVPHETQRYTGWSAHPVTLGVCPGDSGPHGGDGRELGYVSGGKVTDDITRVWVRLDVDELAKLPEIREAVERAAAGV